jgi:hypothetical protein
MNKILFTGVAADNTEKYVREKFELVSTIQEFQIIRGGYAQHPNVLLVIEISGELAYRITDQLDDFCHTGHMIHARLLLH